MELNMKGERDSKFDIHMSPQSWEMIQHGDQALGSVEKYRI